MYSIGAKGQASQVYPILQYLNYFSQVLPGLSLSYHHMDSQSESFKGLFRIDRLVVGEISRGYIGLKLSIFCACGMTFNLFTASVSPVKKLEKAFFSS